MRTKLCIAVASLFLAFAAQAGEPNGTSAISSSISESATFTASDNGKELPIGVDALGTGLNLSPSGFIAEKLDAISQFLKPFVSRMLPAEQESPASN